nr:hypothetical protein HK105_005755 [Polyrhizophydium stewartii]
MPSGMFNSTFQAKKAKRPQPALSLASALTKLLGSNPRAPLPENICGIDIGHDSLELMIRALALVEYSLVQSAQRDQRDALLDALKDNQRCGIDWMFSQHALAPCGMFLIKQMRISIRLLHLIKSGAFRTVDLTSAATQLDTAPQTAAQEPAAPALPAPSANVGLGASVIDMIDFLSDASNSCHPLYVKVNKTLEYAILERCRFCVMSTGEATYFFELVYIAGSSVSVFVMDRALFTHQCDTHETPSMRAVIAGIVVDLYDPLDAQDQDGNVTDCLGVDFNAVVGRQSAVAKCIPLERFGDGLIENGNHRRLECLQGSAIPRLIVECVFDAEYFVLVTDRGSTSEEKQSRIDALKRSIQPSELCDSHKKRGIDALERDTMSHVLDDDHKQLALGALKQIHACDALHGDPHLGNLALVTTDGTLRAFWFDLESTRFPANDLEALDSQCSSRAKIQKFERRWCGIPDNDEDDYLESSSEDYMDVDNTSGSSSSSESSISEVSSDSDDTKMRWNFFHLRVFSFGADEFLFASVQYCYRGMGMTPPDSMHRCKLRKAYRTLAAAESCNCSPVVKAYAKATTQAIAIKLDQDGGL